MIFSETFTIAELKAKASKDYDRIMKGMIAASKDDAKLSNQIAGGMLTTSVLSASASMIMVVAAPTLVATALPAVLTVGAASLAGAGLSKLMEKMFQKRMVSLAKQLESPAARNIFINSEVDRVQESNLRIDTVGRWRLKNQSTNVEALAAPAAQPKLR